MKNWLCLFMLSCFIAAAAGRLVGEDKELANARTAHAKAIADQDDALHRAKQKHSEAVFEAHRSLLAAYDDAIKRALDGGDEATLQKLRSERITLLRSVPQPLSSLPDDAVVECVLGVYGKAVRGEQYAFVNLRPPQGDLWTEAIQEQLRGKVPFEHIEYVATAKLVITKAGWYKIELPARGTQFRLNGVPMSGGEVELTHGVYDVEIYTNTWGQPYLMGARVAVLPKNGTHRISLVNTAEDVKRFLDQRINGRRVVEVSGYAPKAVDINIKGPKGVIKVPAKALPLEGLRLDSEQILKLQSER